MNILIGRTATNCKKVTSLYVSNASEFTQWIRSRISRISVDFSSVQKKKEETGKREMILMSQMQWKDYDRSENLFHSCHWHKFWILFVDLNRIEKKNQLQIFIVTFCHPWIMHIERHFLCLHVGSMMHNHPDERNWSFSNVSVVTRNTLNNSKISFYLPLSKIRCKIAHSNSEKKNEIKIESNDRNEL